MLDFLAFVGGAEAGPGELTITDKMLATTPILEGFGNANMPRNPDSSRFGKLYKIYFDKYGDKTISGDSFPEPCQGEGIGHRECILHRASRPLPVSVSIA